MRDPLQERPLLRLRRQVIVDVEATPARTYDEVEATKTMLDRTEAPASI